ncbi:MAG: HlyD family efflux transporter periplasmic adaptor subunit [Bacteroidia bacterium]|nr:HlyD family efflux transporter periplasmic adaptor subunit [Bacteroidia bacterium]
MIKPREDHTVITTTSSGFVEAHNLSSNLHVNEGDTLLVIKSELITSKLPMLEKRKGELEDLITDLQNLTRKSPYSVKLRSPVYKQDVLYYIAQWNEADVKRKQTKSAYERSLKLFEANVIPLSEFEPVELSYQQAENAIRTLTSYQKRQWASDLIQYENELRDIDTQIEQICIQDTETVVCSPVTGTIQQAQALFDGSYVSAGQQILEISPDGDLVAECYVQPKDIGYMTLGMNGRVQVTAFNYTS